jgi:dGTP triphosphohydrolase
LLPFFVDIIQLPNGTRASWEHLLSLWEIEQSSSLRLCPKLKEEHFTLPLFRKMRVDLAVQVLSHSVAAALHTLTDLGRIPKEAKQTAEFVTKFNQLTDRLNSASISGKGPKSAIASFFLKERCEELQTYQEWVQSWKFEDKRETAKCSLKKHLEFQKGLVLTISAVKGLVESLIGRGYKYVCTRRFGQDCVENLFSLLRRDRGGFNSHPEVTKAIQNLRLSSCNMLLDVTKSPNCEDSGGRLLIHIGRFIRYSL